LILLDFLLSAFDLSPLSKLFSTPPKPQKMAKPSSGGYGYQDNIQENYCVNDFALKIYSDNFLSLTATTFSATTNVEKSLLTPHQVFTYKYQVKSSHIKK
jgi:hypothetical protein